MARAAYLRALQLRGDPHQEVVGIGCTGSIATTRERRGFNEFYCTCWSSSVAKTYHCRLNKEAHRSRPQEDEIVCGGIIKALADACGLPFEIPFPLTPDEPLQITEFQTPVSLYSMDGTRHEWPLQPSAPRPAPPTAVVIPGSFNPLHEGHLAMAGAAARHFERLGRPAEILFELAVLNADKPPIGEGELSQRVAQFRGRFKVLATHAPKFVDKARLLPGCAFVVGYDTARRIVDAKYADNCAERHAVELRTILDAGCCFLVAGRAAEGTFLQLKDLPVPPALTPEEFAALFQPLEDFARIDISSTELRSPSGGA